MADNFSSQLDATIGALNGDLTAVALDQAQSVIDQWRQALSGSNSADLKGIADSLGDLQTCLGAENLSGREIGQTLLQLGQQTGALSHSAEVDPDTTTKLQQLSQALSRAGNAIGY